MLASLSQGRVSRRDLLPGGREFPVVHPWRTLLLGEAERTSPVSTLNGNARFDVPAGSIFSAHDTLFTSGTLGRYCTTILSLPEAAVEVEAEARP